jgi:hypothetical protein
MSRFIGRVLGTILASLLATEPLSAQTSGSMQVGETIISVGVGAATLTLPDVPSFVSLAATSNPSSLQTGTFELANEFDNETGWNIDGSIKMPVSGQGGGAQLALQGFWTRIEGRGNATCLDGNFSNLCMYAPLVDNPALPQRSLTGAIGETISTSTKRDVDHWSGSIETRIVTRSGMSGGARRFKRRYLALGADVRGIQQDLDVAIANTRPGFTTATYTEDLDTAYYGVYAAWGQDYALPLLESIAQVSGLHSSFLLRAGIYHAETDYDGSLVDGTSPQQLASSALSLSRDEVAFIGGLVLKTAKQFGQRTTLSLMTAYEYYSYVPAMAYNQVDASNTGIHAIGGQAGTVIDDDDAFSMRTNLRLTIGLGPPNLQQ